MLASDPHKRRGLIWHTQGSGKTYTMITLAKRLIEEPVFENPTVLMLVDRNELEAQLLANLAAVGLGSVEVAASKRHLQDLLKSDRRGVIVSIIHKFDDIPANRRKSIFVLMDEAHRTTGGDLGNYLMGALPNATYLGFTGTPIELADANTRAMLIKRSLRKYGYPPDKQEKATRTVLEQAEALSAEWTLA